MVEPLTGLLLATTCTILAVTMTTLFFCCWRKKGSSDIDADPAQGHDGMAKGKDKWVKDRSVSPGPEVKVTKAKIDNGNAVQPSSSECIDADDELGDFSAVQRETEILRSYRKPPPPKNRARQSRAPRALQRSTENLDIFTELKEDREKRYSSEDKENIQVEDENDSQSILRDSLNKDKERKDARSSMLADIELTLASLHQEGTQSPTKSNTTTSVPPSSLENKGGEGEETLTEKLTVLGRLEDDSTNNEPASKLTHEMNTSSPTDSPSSKQKRGPKVSPKPSPKVSPKPRALAQTKLQEIDKHVPKSQEISLSQGKLQTNTPSVSDPMATELSETCSPEVISSIKPSETSSLGAPLTIEPSKTSSLGAPLTIEPSKTSSLGAALTTGPADLTPFEAGVQPPAMKECTEDAIPQDPPGDVAETASSYTKSDCETALSTVEPQSPMPAPNTEPAPNTVEPPLIIDESKQIDAKILEEKTENQEINPATKASPPPSDDENKDSCGQTQEQTGMNADEDSLPGQKGLHSASANTHEVTKNTEAADVNTASEQVHVHETHEPEAVSSKVKTESTTEVEPSSPTASSNLLTSTRPDEYCPTSTRTDDNSHRNESEEGKGKVSRIPVRAGSKPRSSPPKVLDGEKPTNSMK